MKKDPKQVLAASWDVSYPTISEISALRAWYAGVSSREAATKYLAGANVNDDDGNDKTSRALISSIRRALIEFARSRHHAQIALLLAHGESLQVRAKVAKQAINAIELLRDTPLPSPRITDDVSLWLPSRCARVLNEHGITSLADLTVRIPRRKRWWSAVDGLGQASAKQIEAFFARHPALVQSAWALISQKPEGPIAPWERLNLPSELDGSQGKLRAPIQGCTLEAKNDYEAIQTWLSLHESPATQRAYKREAERIILWAIVERNKALSSLNTEDAIAYRSFLRAPTPSRRWVGPPVARTSPEWKPFAGGLNPRSMSYALAVIGTMFRWLMEQRYVLANPFAGVKVRGSSHAAAMNVEKVFSEGEMEIIQTLAQALEWTHGWDARAAQRLRFILKFSYATGLRLGELVNAKLGHIEIDGRSDYWLKVKGKGEKEGKVALPPLARAALNTSLMQRGLATTPSKWKPHTHLIGDMQDPLGTSGITSARVWALMRRFFGLAAKAIEDELPTTAEKLRKASPPLDATHPRNPCTCKGRRANYRAG